MADDATTAPPGSTSTLEPPGSSAPGLPRILSRRWAEPQAAKVPEIVAIFWVVKVLTTAGGEATSDWLARFGNVVGGGVELLVFAIGLVLQFGTTRYRAFAYWWLAFSIAIFGTGVADFLHLDVHLSYGETTLLWAVILAAVFVLWHRQEGTLSIHSVHNRRREFYYWCTVFATFALGTALGDLTAAVWKLGFLGSGVLFSILILLPWMAHRWLGLNAVVAFWASYVLTRPVGASWVDWADKPRHLSGLNAGNGPTAAVCFLLVLALVGYLEVARPDVQQGVEQYEV